MRTENTPEKVIHQLAEEALLYSGTHPDINRKKGPGKFLEEKLKRNPELKNILKDLKSDDVKNVRIYHV